MRAGRPTPDRASSSTPLASVRFPAALALWNQEDFAVAPLLNTEFDPWEPLYVFQVPNSPTSENHPIDVPIPEDFWDPAPTSSTDIEVNASDWQMDLLLPDFTPHAAENPFRFDIRIPNGEDKANQRARWLVPYSTSLSPNADESSNAAFRNCLLSIPMRQHSLHSQTLRLRVPLRMTFGTLSN